MKRTGQALQIILHKLKRIFLGLAHPSVLLISTVVEFTPSGRFAYIVHSGLQN